MRILSLFVLVSTLTAGFAVAATPRGPAPSSVAAFTASLGAAHDDAEYARHIAKLRARLPEGDFRIVVEKPFVLVSDATGEDVREWAETVRVMGARLRALLLDKPPAHIVDVFLFQDDESYEANALHLFQEEPETPYGYYLPDDRALVMNMSTGKGTLVHELVHPYLEASFPEAPPWFDEGLASLFERTELDERGRLVAIHDWRLRSLQREMENGTLPTLRELIAMDSREFDSDDGDNYAQARYLCFYLQEQGLLVKFFHAFKKNHRDDPSGYATLRSVLDLDDDEMNEFEKTWAEWVAELELPER